VVGCVEQTIIRLAVVLMRFRAESRTLS